MKSKTAIILGATGLTGGILLENLIADSRYDKIKVFTRNHVKLKHSKIEEYLVDLFELEKLSDIFTGDEVFCCVGTTKKKTPDEEVYRKIDYGIPATAAKLSKKNNIATYMVISALGADANSKFFYNRTKGEMEEAVLDKKIPNTYILQPSLIAGEREESRFFESLGKNLMKLVNPFLVGNFKKYQSIHPESIAKAMIYLGNNDYKEKRIESDKIKNLAERQNNDRNRA